MARAIRGWPGSATGPEQAATITVTPHRQGNTIWTDGSCLDDKRVGTAVVWQPPCGWTGRRYHLGRNKEVFDAEVFCIYQALRLVDRRQESGRRYTIFVDSTAAIEQVRTDALGPGPAHAIAAMESCNRILGYDN